MRVVAYSIDMVPLTILDIDDVVAMYLRDMRKVRFRLFPQIEQRYDLSVDYSIVPMPQPIDCIVRACEMRNLHDTKIFLVIEGDALVDRIVDRPLGLRNWIGAEGERRRFVELFVKELSRLQR